MTMGRLNIASMGLWLGALGQALVLFSAGTGRLFSALGFCLLLIPWLIVFTITFCRVPPFGPRPFMRCLTVSLAWYAVASVVAVLTTLVRVAHNSVWSESVISTVLICAGSLSFIPLLKAVFFLRGLNSGTDSPETDDVSD